MGVETVVAFGSKVKCLPKRAPRAASHSKVGGSPASRPSARGAGGGDQRDVGRGVEELLEGEVRAVVDDSGHVFASGGEARRGAGGREDGFVATDEGAARDREIGVWLAQREEVVLIGRRHPGAS